MSVRRQNEPAVEDQGTTEDVLAAVSDRAVAIASQLPDDASHVTVAAGEIQVEIALGLRDHGGQGRDVPDAPSRAPAASAPSAVELSAGPVETEPTKHVVRATAVGTFYRRPSPTEEEFVKEGDRVQLEDQIAIVEAMKLMIPVKSDASGIVIEFHVADGDPVEFEQPLMTLVREP
jgi:acetyl-CoA carboxylase biotin carboxyl carrier protein